MMASSLMDCLPEIARRIDQAESLVLALDFDGTLTPFRPRPDEVVLPESSPRHSGALRQAAAGDGDDRQRPQSRRHCQSSRIAGTDLCGQPRAGNPGPRPGLLGTNSRRSDRITGAAHDAT